MNTSKLIFAFARRRPLTWSFHALTLALGVAVVTALLALTTGLRNRFDRDLGRVNLVVGAKGSALQLIMSSVFELDVPTGNVPLSTVGRLSRNMLVKRAIPISIGDNVSGYRIVGTTPQYADLYGAKLAQGRWWTKPLEAVVGAGAERRLGLKLGDSFVGDHGLTPGGEAHDQTPYRVVGVLKPTGAVVDRLVLTDIASVWRVHEQENAEHAEAIGAGQRFGPSAVSPQDGREVTAVLVTYRSVMGAIMLPRLVNATANLQAASPAIETAHLTELLGTGTDVLRGFGAGLLALSALGFFVALFAAVSQRRRELALLRALGARPALLFGLIAGEALALGLVGGVAGLALGRLATAFAAARSLASGGPAIPAPPMGFAEAAILGVAALLSLAASIAPGVLAYRANPAAALRA